MRLKNLGRVSLVLCSIVVVVLAIYAIPLNVRANDRHLAAAKADDELDVLNPSVGKATVPGVDIPISRLGRADPTIGVSNDGAFIAVAYSIQEVLYDGIHIKSATETDGWLTTAYLGSGQNPRLVFSPVKNDRVFVVWAKDNGQAIGFADCTLAPLSSPDCAKGEVIRTPGVKSPDIAVDNSGVLHVAWVQRGDIWTARSTDNGQSWTIFQANSDLLSGPLNDFETPRLAVAPSLSAQEVGR